jgi:SAM-dependent methyltransferase
MVASLRAEDEDFEWYPTTAEMINVIVADAKRWSAELDDVESVLDIGAGDGRVLALFRALWPKATSLSIEKSSVLQASQPDWVVPAGTNFHEQDLMAVQAGVVFCNPPYSEFEAWAARIIAEAFCRVLYLIIPQRWVDSGSIKHALASRDATAIVLKSTDFLRADRSARARVDIIRVEFAAPHRQWARVRTPDPFDAWFSQNVSSFDEEQAVDETVDESRLVRLRDVTTIPALVAEFDLDYARMQENYQAIFRLDAALLRELGIKKDALCTAVKTRIAGLKRVYWRALFDRLSSLTTRLATKTRAAFLERVTGRNAIAFTVSNCYSIVMWAIRHADAYFDQQVIDLFFALSQREGVTKYVSNKRTWGDDAWRYSLRHEDKGRRPSHYRLDYRFVVPGYSAIGGPDRAWDFPRGLHTDCHKLIDDIVAVLSTLGFSTPSSSSLGRQWYANVWQNWLSPDGELLFQVKGFANGNLHMRFAPAAIMALNVEAGRLLGWLKSPAEAATELGATQEQTERAWRSIAKLDATKTLALVDNTAGAVA